MSRREREQGVHALETAGPAIRSLSADDDSDGISAAEEPSEIATEAGSQLESQRLGTVECAR